MGEMAKKISKVDNQELLDMLNAAFAEEWLAYYQYWIGSKIAVGVERPKIAEEFKEHAKEELYHAELLVNRIIQLGGTPLLDPKEWDEKAKCKYEIPINADTKALVEQNLISERCAISRYESICNICNGKDNETYYIARKILQQELEHEQEMEDFEADFTYYE